MLLALHATSQPFRQVHHNPRASCHHLHHLPSLVLLPLGPFTHLIRLISCFIFCFASTWGSTSTVPPGAVGGRGTPPGNMGGGGTLPGSIGGGGTLPGTMGGGGGGGGPPAAGGRGGADLEAPSVKGWSSNSPLSHSSKGSFTGSPPSHSSKGSFTGSPLSAAMRAPSLKRNGAGGPPRTSWSRSSSE